MLSVSRIRLLTSVILLLTAASSNAESQHAAGAFTLKFVRMCLKPDFIRALHTRIKTELLCAFACLELGPSCQGFRLAGEGESASCLVHVFDKCSHMVRTDCSQFAWIHILGQSGLPDGQLCPDGFGSGYFGSNYKMLSAASWTEGLTKCSSLPGLTKFADAMDRNETSHMHWIKSNKNSGRSFFIGGWRPGSSFSDPWIWQACNASFLPEVWMPGQPNSGSLAYNRANIWSTHSNGIDDEINSGNGIEFALCECIDPFA